MLRPFERSVISLLSVPVDDFTVVLLSSVLLHLDKDYSILGAFAAKSITLKKLEVHPIDVTSKLIVVIVLKSPELLHLCFSPLGPFH